MSDDTSIDTPAPVNKKVLALFENKSNAFEEMRAAHWACFVAAKSIIMRANPEPHARLLGTSELNALFITYGTAIDECAPDCESKTLALHYLRTARLAALDALTLDGSHGAADGREFLRGILTVDLLKARWMAFEAMSGR